MDVNTVYVVALAISTPIAGFVGFAIQLREVRKARLENEKLQLEIAELKASQVQRESRIILATTDEVLKYNDVPRFSRSRGPNPGPEWSASKLTLSDRLIFSAVVAAIVIFTAYLIFDVYRLVRWVVG